MESWSGRRQRCVCSVAFDFAVSFPSELVGVMRLPSGESGFQRLSITKPGFRMPIAQLMDFTVISLIPPPVREV